MQLSKKNFEKSVFTYFISNIECEEALLPERCSVLGWHIYASELTYVLVAENKTDAVVIVGYCVDSQLNIERASVAEYLLATRNEPFENLISRFGGKFMVFHIKSDVVNVYTDATATLPVYYSCSGDSIFFSSHEFFIAEIISDNVSKQAVSVIKKGDSSKTLPYMMSRYENICVLLPNHYFSSSDNCVHRYDYQHHYNGTFSARRAAEITLPLIKNIASSLSGDYIIKCPLTGGYDSRVVFGVLYNLLGNNFNTYTMRHSMSNEETDLRVPSDISSDYGCSYSVLDDIIALPENIGKCDEMYGKDLYSHNTLNIVSTLMPIYNNKTCLVNGDIVGQIGKSSLHRSIRNCFMGPAYYQCKIHNTSRLARKHIKAWYKSAKSCTPKAVCERFNEEIRLGRWAADENSIYSFLGINVINIFNCTDIIRAWQLVPRKERKVSALHIELIKLLDDKLLKYKFSSSPSVLENVAKKNDILFYAATFAKYAMQVIKNNK